MFHGEIRKRLFRKNYFKLLLLGLVTPLLCGVSFATTYFDDFESYLLDAGSVDFGSAIASNIYPSGLSTSRVYCVTLSGHTTNMEWGFTNNSSLTVAVPYGQYFPANTLVCSWGNKRNVLLRTADNTTHAGMVVSYKVYDLTTFMSATINNGGSDTCDYSEYESIISTLSGSLATCQNSLSQCQASNCDTQLSQCIIDRDNLSSSVSTLSGSLASCNEDKTSLQNYNNSLSSQLNECLAGSGDNLTGESCFNYSMFWQDSDSNYSLPITNNLFLPNGYKGKYDEDNVLSIAKINSLEAAYQFSEEDKVTIIDILSVVMLFLLATGSLIGLIVFLKRLVINRK